MVSEGQPWMVYKLCNAFNWFIMHGISHESLLIGECVFKEIVSDNYNIPWYIYVSNWICKKVPALKKPVLI